MVYGVKALRETLGQTDYTVIDLGVAVDENVAEGDDPLIFADLRGGCWIDPASCASASPTISSCLSTAERSNISAL